MRNIWNEVAPVYASIGQDYWSWFGLQLTERLDVNGNEDILDLGCGQGASLLPLAEKNPKRLVGLDTAEVMIRELRLKCKDRYPFVELYDFDLKTIKHQQFDYIVCGFGNGYMYYTYGIDMIKSMLKTKGQLVMSVWIDQEDQSWLTEIVNQFLPPHESSVDLSSKEGLDHLLQPYFSKVDIKLVNINLTFESKEMWWAELHTHAMKNIINALDQKGNLEEFKSKCFLGIDKQKKNDVIQINREAMIIVCEV